ncbi:MAG: DUF465 domain-containing protein [Gammaproteobacteria bacterium]|nr:DUF465 domain-containing protein [Gammaproteobacteria bacterium]
MLLEDEENLRHRLDELVLEHRDLDDSIAALSQQAFVDQIQMGRLKKRKLKLKDEIEKIRSKLIPDLNA